MIVVTGAAGFIGSCLIRQLNDQNFNRVVAVDDFTDPDKQKNLLGKKLEAHVERWAFPEWLDENHEETEFIFHLGARTDTSEFDRALLWKHNTEYSKVLWQKCCDYQIPLVYASSAATYGDGAHGYDDERSIDDLQPLNPYGESKHAFDQWAIEQEKSPFFWAGLKFFNVYGPNEYHKGRMASVVFHACQQILQTGEMKLFRSHHPDYADGGQMRDFIYVKDVVQIMYWLMHHRQDSGIYNVGNGRARTFLDLVQAVFNNLKQEPAITFIDTPQDIREKYQYFTEAKMRKLLSIGYDQQLLPLEDGIKDYLSTYLDHKSEGPHYF